MGKGGNSTNSSNQKQSQSSKPSSLELLKRAADGKIKKELLVNGQLYDITNFKHPGGSVIHFYRTYTDHDMNTDGTNKVNFMDGTTAFNSFHIRSNAVQKALAKLPSRPFDAPSSTARSAMLLDFQCLTDKLKAKGYFRPKLAHVLYRMVEILIIFAIGVFILKSADTLPHASSDTWSTDMEMLIIVWTGVVQLSQVPIGCILLGIAAGRCCWLMHEGSHYSLTGHIQLDRQISCWFYGVGCGMSEAWWRAQHNKHHTMPQKLGHDVDLETMPFVAFCEASVARFVANSEISFLQSIWFSYQHYLFPLITCTLVTLKWQFYLHPKFIVRTCNLCEATALMLRLVGFTALFSPQYGVSGTVLLFLFYTWVMASYNFIHFAVSHTHLPVVAASDTEVNWVEYSANHTVNIAPDPGGVITWLMSYLNFQIEHHLFPSMPELYLPLASVEVRKFFADHGLKYDSRPYRTALWDTFHNLKKVSKTKFH